MSAFLDTNIPIYATGVPHPLKAPCSEIILLAGRYQDAFITDAEVLQEILHRFIAIHRWPAGKPMFDQFATLMRDRTEPILAEDVEMAAELSASLRNSEARDLVHLAVMRRLGVTRIISADRGFDGLPDVNRLDPARFDEWRDSLLA